MDRLRGSKLHLSLFGFSYEEWTQTCQMYFSLKKAVQNKYLQWFPFSKLSTADKERIKSKSFYDTYIKNGGFLYNNKAVFVTDNYILKTDNSFRDMKLVSGFIFLVLQAIGLSASKKYISRRPKEISAYYAGNYFELRPFYKKEYNKFFKEINRELSEYQYYIKTDVHSFFSNININKLITCLDENCNKNKIRIPPINLHIWKEFLSFCGRGKFPEVENSMASSFFSTVVYLEKLDCLLFEYLLKQDEIQNFKMIRYVDDLYILFNSDLENTNLETIYNKICSYISSVIKDFDLSLNYEKCSISETKDINQVLKQSLYDEYFHEISFKISQFYLNDIDDFLDHLIDCNEKHILTNKEYRESITKYLTHEDIEFSAIEIFNYFVYNKDSFDLVPDSVDKVKRLFEADLNILCLDPKLLTILLLKTKDEELIKKMLNNEFSKFHSSNWTKYDSAIVINYLIQRNFQHFDIKQCLVTESKKLKMHIESYCESSFFEILNDDTNTFIATLLCEDWKSGFIYLMFLAEMQRKNLLTSYAYFKNFFDRITAFLENKDHPDFNKFFKEKNFISFYSKIENSEDILKKAFKMRNNNPVSHASAELINEHYRNEDIVEMINKLHHLLILYIKDKFTE